MCELKFDRIRDKLFQIRESVELIVERVGEIAEPADFFDDSQRCIRVRCLCVAVAGHR